MDVTSFDFLIKELIEFPFNTIPLIISMFVGTWIVRKSFLPKVDINTKKAHVLQDEDGCFLSLNLINIGPNVAQNCCAYIILNDKIDCDSFLNPEEAATNEHLPSYFEEKNNLQIPRNTLITREKRRDVQQIQLCWTHHGNPYQKDLNPGVQTQIDICRYQYYPNDHSHHYMIFPTEKGWRRIHFRLKYKWLTGKLYICPANSYPNIFNIGFGLNASGYPEVEIKKIRLNYFTRKKLLLD